MGAWGIKALERDEGLDVLDILKNEYVPEHPVMDLGEMIEPVSYTHLDVYKRQTVAYILEWFGIPIDTEEAIRERDW